jgi:hypothetical protein
MTVSIEICNGFQRILRSPTESPAVDGLVGTESVLSGKSAAIPFVGIFDLHSVGVTKQPACPSVPNAIAKTQNGRSFSLAKVCGVRL